jgi:hypothetical protein
MLSSKHYEWFFRTGFYRNVNVPVQGALLKVGMLSPEREAVFPKDDDPSVTLKLMFRVLILTVNASLALAVIMSLALPISSVTVPLFVMRITTPPE